MIATSKDKEASFTQNPYPYPTLISRSGAAAVSGTQGQSEEPSLSMNGVNAGEGVSLRPIRKKKKSNEKRGTIFKITHLQRFGLKVERRDAKSSAIQSVSCRFCSRLGREAQPALADAGRRKALQSVKPFSKPWGTDAFEQHLKLQHASKWREYGSANDSEQVAFFDVSVHEIAHMNSLDAHVDTGTLYFWVRENIVLGVIRELFLDPDDGKWPENALNIFKENVEDRPAGVEEGNGPVCVERKITVKKIMAFKLTIDYVAWGHSFRQASNILSHTATRIGLHILRGVREEDVARFVKAIVGINLDKISTLL
jgi:hypothetical protein